MRTCKREDCTAEVVRRKPTGRPPEYCSEACKRAARYDRDASLAARTAVLRKARRLGLEVETSGGREVVEDPPVLSYGPGTCPQCAGPRSTYQEPPLCWQCANPEAAAYAAGVGQ